jgi:UDP-N-acetylglucosamine--N-acetylmuramyl-(pentapeptide) pyrophosphoryl-undecaprenol N-acetylglucosamine transferase
LAGLPSILVPYPYAADDHQTANAKVFSDVGAAKLIQQKELNPSSLATLLTELLTSPGTLKLMASAASSLAVPDAAEKVTTALLNS